MDSQGTINPATLYDFQFSEDILTSVPGGDTFNVIEESDYFNFSTNELNDSTGFAVSPQPIAFQPDFVDSWQGQFFQGDAATQPASEYPDPSDVPVSGPYYHTETSMHALDSALFKTNPEEVFDFNTAQPECLPQHDYLPQPSSLAAVPRYSILQQQMYQGIPGSQEFRDPFAVKPASTTHEPGRSLRPRISRVTYAEEDDMSPPPPVRKKDSFSTGTPNQHGSRPKFRAEKPKRDENRPWIRTNGTTRGLSTRTGKINNFGHGTYQKTDHPLGNWQSNRGTSFAYNEYGELHAPSFHASEIQDFIYNHPFNTYAQQQGNLTLWIQKVPGDSSKRFETLHGDKCRFYECPAGVYKHATIGQGAFRVALDEQWACHGDARDPMHVAGYLHLYCAERFLDFKDITRRFDVRCDDRDLPKEPTGEWMAGLGRETPEARFAKSFVSACKTGDMRDWPEYPPHLHHDPTAEKAHGGTLTCALNKAKIETTGHSKMEMMRRRGFNRTNFFVNLGDLQMQVNAQRDRTKAKQKQRYTNDGFPDEEETRPARRQNVAPTAPKGAAAGKRRRSDEDDDKDYRPDQPVQRRRVEPAFDDGYDPVTSAMISPSTKAPAPGMWRR